MSRVCFVSYEIHPTTWGGCGVLLYNAARALLAQGHEVIFVLDIPRDYFDQFQSQDRLAFPHAERCRAYHVDSLCETLALEESDFISHSAWKAYRFDHACRQVHAREHPDVIEFFDYCGVGHYALSAKVAGLAYAGTHLTIRLHNSVELMDSYEPTKPLDADRYILYALEHSALRLAETVLYPSSSYLDEAYRPHYEPWFGQQVCSQSPLIDAPQLHYSHPNANIVLFYGRLFAFKGVDIFVDAAVAYLNNPANPRMLFYLIGYDSYQAPIKVDSYQSYLWRKIPSQYRSHFVFPGQLSWKQLEELLPRVKFGVFPSYFESFCYAAHELYSAGVPIIVSNIPGFKDFFRHEVNALVFNGSVSDLECQLTRLSTNDELRHRITRPFPVADKPLGNFYAGPFESSWITQTVVLKQPSLLVCIIDNGEEGLSATLTALDRAGLEKTRIVFLRSANNGSNGGIPTWLLGSLYVLCDRNGEFLEPTEVYTAELLLILRAGDVPTPGYFMSGLDILARQPQIAFVGSWKQFTNQGQPHLQTFPLDATLESVPFYHLPALSRCLMRTPAAQLLIELFDPRAGRYGELAYLWSLETEQHCGLIIPQVLLTQAEAIDEIIDPKLLAYLVMRDHSTWRKTRLARYLLTVWNSIDQQTIDVAGLLHRNAQLERQLAEINKSRAWNFIQSYRSKRHRNRALKTIDRLIRQPLWHLLHYYHTKRQLH